MVCVVEPHSNELADAPNRTSQTRRTVHDWQGCWIKLGQAREHLRCERLSINICDLAGEVANASVGVQQPGLFLPGRTIAQELHRSVLLVLALTWAA